MKNTLPISVKMPKYQHSLGVRKYSRVVNEQFKSYAAETSIHGIKYMNANGRHWSERYIG